MDKIDISEPKGELPYNEVLMLIRWEIMYRDIIYKNTECGRKLTDHVEKIIHNFTYLSILQAPLWIMYSHEDDEDSFKSEFPKCIKWRKEFYKILIEGDKDRSFVSNNGVPGFQWCLNVKNAQTFIGPLAHMAYYWSEGE